MSEWQPPQGEPRHQEYPQYQQPSYAAAAHGAPPPHPLEASTDKRPGTVTAAAVLTWVGCGLAGAGCVLLVALSGADAFMRSFQDGSEGQFTRAEAQGILVGIGVVGFVWSVVASVLALLTVKRHGWARIALTISAAMAALVSLLTILSVVTVVTLVLAVAAVVLLFVGGANDWFAHRPGQRYSQPGSEPTYYA
jgi:hypothetical protein